MLKYLSHLFHTHSQTASLVCLLSVMSMFAGTTQATELVGRVVDNAEARVFSGATVQIRKNSEKRLEALSNTDGFFRLSNVAAGAYTINISLADGRSFMTRLLIHPKHTTQFIELDYSRMVPPDEHDDY